MQRFLLTLILCLLVVFAHAQIRGASGNSILAFEGGYTTFRPYELNDSLFGTGSPKSFTTFYTVGITKTSNILTGRSASWDATWGFHFFIPQEIVIVPDTLRYKAGGWEIMTSLYGFDLLNSARANTDLVIAPGVYWGSMRLKKYFSGGNPKQFELFKNGFIAPMVRADLRVQFWKISLGGRVSWRYDITSSKWKKGTSMDLPGYKCEEWQYMVYIGIWLNSKK